MVILKKQEVKKLRSFQSKICLFFLCIGITVNALSSCSSGTETSNPDDRASAEPTEATVSGKTETVADDGRAEETSESRSEDTVASLTKQTIGTTDGSTLSFWLYTPCNARENMPMIVYLHGGSGKGDQPDIIMQNDGFPKYLKDGKLGDVPAYVVIPQLSSSHKGWADIKNSIRDLITYCVHTYQINADKVGLTGHSMGGTGAWNLAVAFPDLFSCVAPMSGSIRLSEANLQALKNMPVWAFVGSDDQIVLPESSVRFIEELRRRNAGAGITVVNGADHFAIPEVYLSQEYDLVTWILTQ